GLGAVIVLAGRAARADADPHPVVAVVLGPERQLDPDPDHLALLLHRRDRHALVARAGLRVAAGEEEPEGGEEEGGRALHGGRPGLSKVDACGKYAESRGPAPPVATLAFAWAAPLVATAPGRRRAARRGGA